MTAVCNTKNVELVRSLGADEVVDYLREDFTANGQTYDAIIDAVDKYSFLRGRHSLKRGGIYVATDGFRKFLWAAWTWRIGDRRLKFANGRKTKEDVQFLARLIEAGQFRPSSTGATRSNGWSRRTATSRRGRRRETWS